MDILSTTLPVVDTPPRSHVILQYEPDYETLDEWRDAIEAWQQAPRVNVHMINPLKAALTFRD